MSPSSLRSASVASGRTRKFSEFVGALESDPAFLFRCLIILSTGAYAAWFFQFLLFGRLIPPETWDALAWAGYGALLSLPESVSWLLLLLNLAAALGLWSFSKSARVVYAMLTCFDVLLTLLGGVSTQTALGSFLAYVVNLSAGSILVMAFTKPLTDKFQ